MRNQDIVGKVFALTLCPAEDDSNNKLKISGLFMVEEITMYEPAAFSSEGVYVFPAEYKDTGDGPMYWIDANTFFEQTDPQGYGRMLVQEREAEFAAERFDEEYGHIFQ